MGKGHGQGHVHLPALRKHCMVSPSCLPAIAQAFRGQSLLFCKCMIANFVSHQPRERKHASCTYTYSWKWSSARDYLKIEQDILAWNCWRWPNDLKNAVEAVSIEHQNVHQWTEVAHVYYACIHFYYCTCPPPCRHVNQRALHSSPQERPVPDCNKLMNYSPQFEKAAQNAAHLVSLIWRQFIRWQIKKASDDDIGNENNASEKK